VPVGGLYLYAVLGDRPRRPLGRGLRGEWVRAVRAGGLIVAAGAMDAAPRPSLRAVRAHDATVRRLAGVASAVLPVRFGTLVGDAAELDRRLEAQAPALARALALVAGREQMTLRVAAPGPRPGGGLRARRAAGRPGGPGARYLVRLARARAVPGLAPLRAAVRRFVRAERVEPDPAVAGAVRVHHLVDRGRSGAYAAAVRSAARALPGLRLTVTGPWAPYAFAPEAGA
jgi:hypothetical protein